MPPVVQLTCSFVLSSRISSLCHAAQKTAIFPSTNNMMNNYETILYHWSQTIERTEYGFKTVPKNQKV